jgi:hypothetical protein
MNKNKQNHRSGQLEQVDLAKLDEAKGGSCYDTYSYDSYAYAAPVRYAYASDYYPTSSCYSTPSYSSYYYTPTSYCDW